jgi:hypothetical protein
MDEKELNSFLNRILLLNEDKLGALGKNALFKELGTLLNSKTKLWFLINPDSLNWGSKLSAGIGQYDILPSVGLDDETLEKSRDSLLITICFYFRSIQKSTSPYILDCLFLGTFGSKENLEYELVKSGAWNKVPMIHAGVGTDKFVPF